MYKYFTVEELQCPCGLCEGRQPSPTLMFMLDEARSVSGIPFIITSGIRCPEHNKAVGGTMDSEHVDCEGVDIAVESSWARMKIMHGLMKAGFSRIGIGKDFIHAGVSQTKPRPIIWTYY